MNRRYDNAAVIILQQLVEPDDAAGVLQIAEAERGKILQHLIL